MTRSQINHKLASKTASSLEQLDFSDGGELHLGIDIGSISCKLALLDNNRHIRYSCYRRTHGRPLQTARAMLGELLEYVPADRIASIAGTGSACRTLCDIIGIDFINELICQAAAIRFLRPETRTLIEMGGQDSKIIFLSDPNDKSGNDNRGEMIDFSMNTNCAAGTGSFLDQQATRLGVNIEKEFGEMALKSEAPPRVAGRCSVFAKSDMIHLQQQATPVHDIVAGLCLGLARNLKSSLCQGKKIIKPIAFCGGVASNAGVIRSLETVFELGENGLIVPPEHNVTGAIGAVLLQLRQGASQGSMQEPRVLLGKLDDYLKKQHHAGHRLKPLAKPSHDAPASRVHKDILDKARQTNTKIPAYIGIDVGSISTNVVVMDENKHVLSKAYLMTASRPLEAVRKGLDIVGKEVNGLVEIKGAATTGSGRYLTGDFIGADLVINEITAQATGAALVDMTVDTIFEIGGQDSKYISLEDGVVVDFEMNHACAAGTGSFLEEQAERLDMNIKQEFANEAFKSQAPVKLGERCTVFMESDLISYQQQGVDRPDLVAGLCYSIVTNYLNRVVSHRKVGQKVFFQGGTAFNRAVVAAFEAVLGKEIIVPDHHEVTGALGAAELARRHMQQKQNENHLVQSTFKGFDLSQLEYSIRTFECQHCPNNCEIKEVTIHGSGTFYYGSRCDRYNVKKDDTKKNKLPDLFAQRQRMMEKYARLDQQSRKARQSAANTKTRKTIGIPMCLSNYQILPLWSTFIDELGFEPVLSGRTTREVIQDGVAAVLAQPCFPVKVAHGHVMQLIKKDVDFIWLPSVVSMPVDYPENKHNQLCPYVQTIPYQVKVALKAKGIDLTGPRNHLLDLHVRFQDGIKGLQRTLWPLTEKLNVTKAQINRAINIALQVQEDFDNALVQMGKDVLSNLKPDQKACVLVSRPYNGCDPGVSLDLPRKLRNMNVQAIPMDCLDLKDAHITEPALQEDMYWKYGQRILRAAYIIRDNPQLSAVYLSNFSCGPDSFITSMFKELMVTTTADGRKQRKPSLIIEIDEHSADAGVVTRLEAFHESLKSVENHWKNLANKNKAAQADTAQADTTQVKVDTVQGKQDQLNTKTGAAIAAGGNNDVKTTNNTGLNQQELVACASSCSSCSYNNNNGDDNGPCWQKDWGDCSDRVLYIPWMGDAAHALAAAFRHCGQPAEVLPKADDVSLRWGRKFTSGKECLPCIITTGDMLKKLDEPGIDPNKAAFFMPGGSGPCRFGQYNSLQKLILKQFGAKGVPVVAPNQDSSFYDAFKKFRKDPTRLAFDGIAAVDLLHKAMLKIRPYETEPGSTDKAYDQCLQMVISAIEQGYSEKRMANELMPVCTEKLASVKIDKSHPKPRICVVGEIYTRLHNVANGDAVRQLEALGMEVELAGFAEWLYYTNLTRKLMAKRWRDPKLYLQNMLKDYVQHKIEKKLARAIEAKFGPLAEGDIWDVVKNAAPYIHHSFEGEAVLTIGKIIESAHHGAAGAVNIMPFTCMPSTIVSGILRQVTEDFHGLPVLNISYDGQQDPTLQTRMEAFTHQATVFAQQRSVNTHATSQYTRA